MPSIRPATEADIPTITAIYAHHVLHGSASFEEVPPTPDDMLGRMRAITGGGYPYLVAEEDGVVAAYGYLGAYRPRSAYRFTVEDSVYVAEAARGRGLGRAILGALLQAAEAGPWHQVIAVIGDSGSTGSIRLHETMGFRPVGVFRDIGFKHGRWLDTVLMQKSLPRARQASQD